MQLPKFTSVPIQECGEPLVDLSSFDFVQDAQYFKQGLTGEERMFLRKGVAEKLVWIQEHILSNYSIIRANNGIVGTSSYRFKIWDGWRSRDVQKKLFDRFSAELREKHPEWGEDELVEYATRYVNMGADESIVPPHLTGGTIDLTLVDETGAELDMGTGFDYFGEESASLYFETHPALSIVKTNRDVLRSAMLTEGFYSHPHEWWHFEYGTQSWALASGKSAAVYGPSAP